MTANEPVRGVEEGWNSVDMLGMLQQIDAVPATPSLSEPTGGRTGADPSGKSR